MLMSLFNNSHIKKVRETEYQCTFWVSHFGTNHFTYVYETNQGGGLSLVIKYQVRYQPEGANPQRVSTEIIIEIKQLNSGRMASQASIESIWCTH